MRSTVPRIVVSVLLTLAPIQTVRAEEKSTSMDSMLTSKYAAAIWAAVRDYQQTWPGRNLGPELLVELFAEVVIRTEGNDIVVRFLPSAEWTRGGAVWFRVDGTTLRVKDRQGES
jgi:hypothetical protein